MLIRQPVHTIIAPKIAICKYYTSEPPLCNLLEQLEIILFKVRISIAAKSALLLCTQINFTRMYLVKKWCKRWAFAYERTITILRRDDRWWLNEVKESVMYAILYSTCRWSFVRCLFQMHFLRVRWYECELCTVKFLDALKMVSGTESFLKN
mgnify:FL=1